ncbi:baseplate wedge [Eurybiavirus PHM1]|uniref:Baseplate wedge n=1 Tax=Prochlorococcus phage P-HM1 TaxID=445700 RepID=E3SMR7_9CAUD|nr:baseplate wedge subunit [Prochlorococcus phage P-HM1]ADO98710.1 baseplate wedge [Prochlorococcus phage P-HM1]
MAFNQVNALEFNQIKAQIKEYLRSQSQFSDYDFEGSSLTVLIDTLAYNTYYTSVNANLAVNEGFLETAVLRENVVKLARMIGYTPKSARSARTTVDIAVQTAFPYPKSVTIAAGLVLNFTGLDNNNFVFSIPTDITQSVDSLTGIASFNNTVLYEGLYLQDTFVKNTAERQRFILTNERVDATSMIVQVTSGTVTEKYLQATDITKIDATSKVFFLEESEYQIPEILFGDGVVGKALANGDVVTVKYTTSAGTGANGLKVFENIGTFRDNANNAITSGISISAVSFPDGGAEPESTEAIKFSAPKFYSAFGRAVSTRDYEAIIPQIYPNVSSIACYGGEEAEPPEFGKVFLAIKPRNADKLSLSEKNSVLKKLREYSVAAIQPTIIDPSILYVDLTSFVYYNPNNTRKSPAELKNLILTTLTVLNSSGEFNKFGGKFKYSKIQNIIDDAERSITSNITRIAMRKNITVDLNTRVNYKICYGNRINQQTTTNPAIISSGFKIVGDDINTYYLNDDGNSTLRLYYVKGTGEFEYVDGLWGTVDYDMGEIVINDLIIQSTNVANNTLQIKATPKSNDLVSLRETYITMGIDNSVITVVEDTISSGSNLSGTGVIPESSY